MSWRFRRSKEIIPGVKFNLGKKSASVTVGGKYFRKTFNTSGKVTTSASIPKTGLYYSKSSNSGRNSVQKKHEIEELSISSYKDFLGMEDLKALSLDDFQEYAAAFVDYTENLDPSGLSDEEQQYILTYGELLNNLYKIRINDIKIQKMYEASDRERQSKRIEPIVWFFVVLCCLSMIAEYAGMLFGLPVPVLPAIGACVIFGIFAWALSAKL